ncbi:MAG: redoxin domain-containing protein [bacterium]
MAANVGESPPTFTLPDGEFRPFPLKAYLGRPVLLAFVPAVFSPICTREILALQERLAALETANVQVAGISVDGPYALRAFARQHGVAFPLLSDFHRETIQAYDVEDTDFLGLRGVARRATFLIDAEGIIRYRWVAEKPRVEPDYEDILRAVKALSTSRKGRDG